MEKTEDLSSPVSVFVIDNNHLFREWLKQLFYNSPFAITGEVSSFREFNDVQPLVPDGSIILLNFPEAFNEASEELRIVRSRFSAARLVVLASLEEQESFMDCVQIGSHRGASPDRAGRKGVPIGVG